MLAYFMKKEFCRTKLQNSAYALIIGGALANMVDRAYNGFVVDFLDFYWDIYHYPFNVADIAICIGAGLLALDAFKGDKRAVKMKIILANPRGFCAGVDRAISIVELALEIHGAPIYVRHEVVHNRLW